MNSRNGARLMSSWTAGRPQHHSEGLFCRGRGRGSVTWSPQRLSGCFEDAFLAKLQTSFVDCIHGAIEHNPGDGRCGAAPLGGPRGQQRDVVSPACPGSSLGPLPCGTCMEHPPKAAFSTEQAVLLL
ncbi:uncharacterized protein LOC144987994 [Oryzias latipes]